MWLDERRSLMSSSKSPILSVFPGIFPARSTGMTGPLMGTAGSYGSSIIIPNQISKEEARKSLELIYSFLIDNNINGIIFNNEFDSLVLMHPNLVDSPYRLATVSVYSGPKVVIDSDIKQIPDINLAEPDSLNNIISSLEDIVNHYNSFAKLMKEFGSDLIEGNVGMVIRMEEFNFRR